MLTYPNGYVNRAMKGQNAELVARAAWLGQNSEKPQRMHGDFLDFILRQIHPEFVQVKGFELLDAPGPIVVVCSR